MATLDDPCCGNAATVVAQQPDCARQIVNIRQVDACQNCNTYVIPVRACGACVTCK